MEDKDVQAGEIVMLNSGGPKMVVEAITGDRVKCVWSDYNQMPQRAEFPTSCVRKIVKRAGVLVRISEESYQEIFSKLPPEQRFVHRDKDGLLFDSIDKEHSILIQSVAIESPEVAKE